MQRRNGFSLMELSIVLVIVALLVGGIFAGKSLVRAAELRAIAGDAQKYRSAVNQFRTQYNAYPGDFLRATKYWGVRAGSTGNDATCWDAASTDAPTCNGNGNGQINSPDGTARNVEEFLAWQHLLNANFITGAYSGTSTSNQYVAGTNSPSSRTSANATYALQTVATITNGQTLFFSNHDGENNVQRMTFAAIDSTGAVRDPVLTPSEMMEMDRKLDDGQPAYGEIFAPRATHPNAANCTTGTTPQAAAYKTSYKYPACFITWYKPF